MTCPAVDRCRNLTPEQDRECGYALIHGLCPICDDIGPELFVSQAHYGAWMRGQPIRNEGRIRIMERHRQLIYRRDRYRCVHCGSTEHLTIGHRVPVIFGGRNTPGNYQTECQTCNTKAFTPDMRAARRTV